MVRLLLLALAVVLLVGCSPNVDVTKTSKGFNAQTDPNNVEVLMTKPDKKFIFPSNILNRTFP